MYSTPSKLPSSGPGLEDSVSTDGDAYATPVKLGGPLFGAPRKATPTKPSGSANYKCFVNIAREGWTLERSSELATTLMAQVSAGRDINASRRSTGDTPLHTIVATAAPFIVQAFLSHGADPSVKNHAGRSALHFAVRNPSYKVARMIWRQLAQVHPELLTEADAKDLTPLHEAAMSGNIEVIGYLVLEAYQSAKRNNPSATRPLKDLIDSHQRNLLHSLFEARWTPLAFDRLKIVAMTMLDAGVDRFAKDDRHRTPLKALIFKSVVVVPDSAKKSNQPHPSLSNFKISMKGIPLLKLGKRDANSDSAEHAPTPELASKAGSNASSGTLSIDSEGKDSQDSASALEEPTEENPVVIAEVLLQGLDPREADRNIMLMFKNDVGTEWQEDWRPVQQAMQIPEYFPFLPTFAAHCSIESLSCVLKNGRSIWHYLANMGAQSSVLEAYAAHFADKGTPRASVEPGTGISVPHAAPHVLYIRTMVSKTFDALMSRPDADLLTTISPFDLNRQTPLHTAATYNNVVAIRKIFETFGSDSQSWSDADGKTALHYSVQFDTILALLEMRSLEWNLNPVDSKGQTPYALAIELRRKKASELLRAWGASLGDNAPADVNFDASESADIPDVPASPRVDNPPAGESASTRRLSLSLSTLPTFDPEPTPSVRLEDTVAEEDENEEDEELPEDSLTTLSSVAQNRSTAALVSAINRAKVRDQEVEEESSFLRSEVERLKRLLAEKEGEAVELENALNSRPSIEEHNEALSKALKTQQSNESLTSTVRSLRQHVADLGLQMDDERRSRSSSTSTPPSSPIRDTEYKQSLHDYEKHIELLNTQLLQARKLAADQIESNKKQSDDLLAQFRRQLDDAQAHLSKEEMLRIEAEEMHSEKEQHAKQLRAELDALSAAAGHNSHNQSLQAELEQLADELRLSTAQADEHKAALKASDVRVADLIAELSTLKQQIGAQQLVSSNEEELLELRSEVDRLRIQLQSLSSSSAEHDQTELLQRIHDSETAQELTQAENMGLRSELESLKRANETLLKAVETLDIATQMLKTDDDQRKRLLEKLEHELSEATVEMEKLRNFKSSHSQTTLLQAKSQMEELDNALRHIHEKLETDSKEQLLAESTALVSESQAQVASLLKELSDLKAKQDEQATALHSALSSSSEISASRHNDLLKDLESASQRLTESEKSKSELSVEKAKLEAQLDALKLEHSSLQALFQDLSKSSEAKYSSLEASLQTIISSHATNSATSEDKALESNLLAKLEESETRHSELLALVETLREESFKGHESMKEEYGKAGDSFREVLSLSTQSIANASEAFKSEQESYTKRIESLEGLLSTAQKDSESIRMANDSMVADLTSKLKSSESKSSSLLQELRALQASSATDGAESIMTELNSKLEASEAARSSLEDLVTKLERDLESSSTNSKIELEALRAQIDSLRTAHQSELSESSSKLSTAKSDLQGALGDISLLKERLESSNREKELLDQSMRSLTAVVDALKTSESGHNQTLEALGSQLEKLSQSQAPATALDTSSLERSISRLSEQVANIPSSTSDSLSNDDQQAIWSELRSQITAREAERLAIAEELVRVRNELSSLMSSSTSANSQVSDVEREEMQKLQADLASERRSKEEQILKDADLRAGLERSLGEAKASSVSVASQLEQSRKTLAEKALALEKANEALSTSKATISDAKADLRHAHAEIERLKALQPSDSLVKDDATSAELRQLREQTSSILAQLAAIGTNTPGREDLDKKLLEDVKGAISGVSHDLQKQHETLLNKVSIAPAKPSTTLTSTSTPKMLYAGVFLIALIVMAILALQLESLVTPSESTHYFS